MNWSTILSWTVVSKQMMSLPGSVSLRRWCTMVCGRLPSHTASWRDCTSGQAMRKTQRKQWLSSTATMGFLGQLEEIAMVARVQGVVVVTGATSEAHIAVVEHRQMHLLCHVTRAGIAGATPAMTPTLSTLISPHPNTPRRAEAQGIRQEDMATVYACRWTPCRHYHHSPAWVGRIHPMDHR